jgi:competence protein ComEC
MNAAEYSLISGRMVEHCTVLKVAHHGSDTSTTAAFLTVVNPQVAVISVGPGNDYGLPKADIVARLGEKVGEANVYLTSDKGTISFTTDGEKLWVETDK